MSDHDTWGGKATGQLSALALFSAATLIFFAGLLPRLGDSIGLGAGDQLFNLYVLQWGSHQISEGLDGFWSAPFFHPTPNALALSDHLLGPAAAFHVLRMVGATPQAAYNVLVLATFALSGWTAWWVLRRSGVSWAGAVVGGWTFAFSTFRWHSLGHYQTIRMQWIPLTMWTFDRVLTKPTPGRAAAFLVFYALHVSGGAYLAYLVHIALAVLLINRWWTERGTFEEARSWAIWVPTAALALAVIGLFYSGYLTLESALVAGQRSEEIRRWGADVRAFVPAPVLTLLTGRSRGGALFPGLAVCSLALTGLWWGWRRFASPRQERVRRLAGAALVLAGGATALAGLHVADRFTRSGESLVPALIGPGNAGYLPPLAVALAGAALLWWGFRMIRGGRVLRWREMPVWPRGLLVSGAVMLALCLPVFFWPISTVLPGMATMRVPHRAFAFVALPLAYLAGVGWDRLWSRGRGRAAWRLVPTALAVLLLVESVGAKPKQEWQSLPHEAEFPAYAHWIAEHPEVAAYLELPRGRWSSAETVPMYFQTLHWRPLANGHSGRHPASYQELIRLCQPFPDVAGLERLGELGLTHLVVHWRALPWHPGPRVRKRVPVARPIFEHHLRQYDARQVFVDGDTVVFDIRRGAEER